jgi:hypothetical protein
MDQPADRGEPFGGSATAVKAQNNDKVNKLVLYGRPRLLGRRPQTTTGSGSSRMPKRS